MFPNRDGSFMDPSNYRKRVLHKLAWKLELPKLTFQVIRRTIATLGKTKGHVKDIQGIMRHTKASTTTDVYMQSLQPEVRSAIKSIYDELVGNGTNGLSPREQHQDRLVSRSAKEAFIPSSTLGSQISLKEIAGDKRTTLGKPVRGVVWSLLHDCYKVAEGRDS